MSENDLPDGMGMTRRNLLLGATALAMTRYAGAAADPAKTPYGLPGPYRGRVVEVFHPDSVFDGKIDADAVRTMMRRGMCELTGAKDETAAWKRFFKPGDVVAVKGSGVGQPRSISQHETLKEVFRGLSLAGVRNEDIVMYERYEVELFGNGFDKIIPPGARFAFVSHDANTMQVDTDGYDPETYVEFPRIMTGADAGNPVHRRSHLNVVVSKQVTKVINVAALKDHASAGVTMALKNMSHGFVNNVCRTHINADNNWCATFIPAIVALPKIRQKVVLHIGDGLIGTYDGGPGAWNLHFKTWEYRSLFFATDPVAMDRIGWEILDRKRVEAGLPRLAETGIKAKNPGFEQFNHRQPEHVLLAAKAGLGEADLAKIKHTRIELKGDPNKPRPTKPPVSSDEEAVR
ncbi:MAG: DUF362 domain-containing protein [Capsulimonadales bacterium]|nr:DUF362 domain-containing protein [Capsulimonadales bacterium]